MRKLFSMITFIALLLSMFITNVKANTQDAYNIITNPGEDMSTMMHVSYHSDIEGTYVELTKYEDETYQSSKIYYPESVKWSRVEGEEEETGWISNGFYERYVCRVVLDDLEPNTKYRYRVGKNNFSEDYFFTTASDEAFSFVHITDPQYYSKATSEIFNDLLTKVLEVEPNISFGLFTGDVVDRGGDAQQWSWFFEKSNINKLPYAVTPGNHEYYDRSTSPKMTSNDYFIHHYFNPQNGPETDKYSLVGSSYYFKYNNTLFIAIDTEVQVPINQTNWFKDVVMNNPAQFIIVGMHRSFYGSQYETHSQTVRNTWQKTFEECGVDLVLAGHDHVYARSHLMYQNQETDDHTKGITYIIGGSGGSKFYPVRESSKKYYAKYVENTTVANIITVDDEKIALKLIDLQGNVLDTHTILAKRPTIISEDFSKQAFIDNIKLTQSDDDLRHITISWPNTGYGHVESVNVDDSRLKYNTLISSPHRTSVDITLLAGRNYNILVTVNFKNGGQETLEFSLSTKKSYGTITDVKVIDITKTSAILKWNQELVNQQIREYRVFVNDEEIAKFKPEQDNFTLEGLTRGTNYQVKFQAIDIYGDIVFEEQLTFTTKKGGCNSLAVLAFVLPLLGLGFISLRRQREDE